MEGNGEGGEGRGRGRETPVPDWESEKGGNPKWCQCIINSLPVGMQVALFQSLS